MIQSGLICALVWILMQGTDRLLGWQTLQRPIVTATVTGFLLGDIRTGMIMAASLEAIFMGILLSVVLFLQMPVPAVL